MVLERHTDEQEPDQKINKAENKPNHIAHIAGAIVKTHFNIRGLIAYRTTLVHIEVAFKTK